MRRITFADDTNVITVHRSSLNQADSPLNSREQPAVRSNSMRNVQSVALSSAFSSGIAYNQKLNEVVFYAGEDIYRDSVVGTRELAIKKHCKCKLDLDELRTYESYCFEFCGLLNLKFSDVKFMIGRKDVVMVRTVRKACEILVLYNTHQKTLKA